MKELVVKCISTKATKAIALGALLASLLCQTGAAFAEDPIWPGGGGRPTIIVLFLKFLGHAR